MPGAFNKLSVHTQLGRIALAVAYAIDNEAQCIAGVALLHETAGHFGFELTPRAVSMVGQVIGRPDTTVVTGEIARGYVRDHGGIDRIGRILAAVPDGSEFQRAGHLIATLDHPAFLIDPTFGQFTSAGLPDLVPVEAFDPAAESWQLGDDRVRVLYIFDDANRGWQDSYDAVRADSLDEAAVIADHLKAGGEPHSHPIRLNYSSS
jgi:hypothetical protein